jgi:hypothetical protein
MLKVLEAILKNERLRNAKKKPIAYDVNSVEVGQHQALIAAIAHHTATWYAYFAIMGLEAGKKRMTPADSSKLQEVFNMSLNNLLGFGQKIPGDFFTLARVDGAYDFMCNPKYTSQLDVDKNPEFWVAHYIGHEAWQAASDLMHSLLHEPEMPPINELLEQLERGGANVKLVRVRRGDGVVPSTPDKRNMH